MRRHFLVVGFQRCDLFGHLQGRIEPSVVGAGLGLRGQNHRRWSIDGELMNGQPQDGPKVQFKLGKVLEIMVTIPVS